MKKLISKNFTTDPNKLFIPVARTLEHLQESWSDAVDEAMRSMFGVGDTTPSGGYILRGCVNTIVGASNSITEGAIYFWLNGAAWSGATTYALYDLISSAGVEYISLQAANLNNTPASSPTYWAPVGGHLTGQIFQVNAVTINPLVNVVVAKIVPTYQTGDPATYTDGSTANVHADFRIAFVDALTGTGISDFSALQIFPDKWHTVGAAGEPAFTNSWTLNGNPVKFRKDSSGFVCMEGIAIGGASGSSAFTLPAAYRPVVSKRFRVCSFVVADSTVITIAAAGTVTIEYTGAAGTTSAHLDQVRFHLD